MQDNNFLLETSDSQKIFTRQWSNVQTPKAIIQIAHGMCEHSERYTRFAATLNQAGYVVFANDHRGHGQTALSADQLGFFSEKNGWQRVVNDMHELTQQIKAHYPDYPIILFGHSMGSFLSQQYLAKYGDQVDAAILSGSGKTPGFLLKLGQYIAKFEICRTSPEARSKLLHLLSFGDYNRQFKPIKTDFDWLSRDIQEVERYVADPLCGFPVTNQMWLDLFGGLSDIQQSQTLSAIPDLPIYIVSGDRDPVGSNGKGLHKLQQSLQQYGKQKVTLQLYPEGRHEMLNETNREVVVKNIIQWLDLVI